MSRLKNDMLEIQALAAIKMILDDEYLEQAIKCLEQEKEAASNDEKEIFINLIADLKRYHDREPSLFLEQAPLFDILRYHFHFSIGLGDAIKHTKNKNDMSDNIIDCIRQSSTNKALNDYREIINSMREKIRDIKADMADIKAVDYSKQRIENATHYDKITDDLTKIQNNEVTIQYVERCMELIKKRKQQIDDFLNILNPEEAETIRKYIYAKDLYDCYGSNYHNVKEIIKNHIDYWQ